MDLNIDLLEYIWEGTFSLERNLEDGMMMIDFPIGLIA